MDLKYSEAVVVPIGKTTLWLFGINTKEELVFKSSHNMAYTQCEAYSVHEGNCYVAAYFFPSEFLNKLPQQPIE